jgi:hypothetical protein
VSITKCIGPAAIAFALWGCGDIPKPTLTPAPTNYRQLAANYIASVKPSPAIQPRVTITPVSISDIRISVPPQPGDWEACVKVIEGRTYAVFYADGKVTDLRLALAVDCRRTSTFYPMPRPQASKVESDRNLP